MVCKFFRSEQFRHVRYGCNPVAFQYFKAAVNDLDLAGPFSLYPLTRIF